jgi:hypothetical protein
MGMTLCKLPARSQEWNAVHLATWDKNSVHPRGVAFSFRKLVDLQENHQLCYVKVPAVCIKDFMADDYLYHETDGEHTWIYAVS